MSDEPAMHVVWNKGGIEPRKCAACRVAYAQAYDYRCIDCIREGRVSREEAHQMYKRQREVFREQQQEVVDNYVTETEEHLKTAHDAEEHRAIKGIEEAMRLAFGEGVGDVMDGYANTAHRVFHFWQEFRPKDELDFVFKTFQAEADQLIICKDIDFASLCAHHLAPFYGKAHVGYLPHTLQVGLSKIPRLVDFWARRPQNQELLTQQISKDLKDRLQAKGVAVVIEARHTCMACRGVTKHHGVMVTSSMAGVFLTAGEARREFLALIDRDRL
jgi:GTP cyclohydrolase I